MTYRPRKLVYQLETGRQYKGAFYGFEVFEADGAFDVVLHTRIYEGVRVASGWASHPLALDATSPEDAWTEAREHMKDYMRALKVIA